LANDGAWLRIAAVPVGRAKKPRGEHGSNLGVRHDAPAGADKLVAERQGRRFPGDLALRWHQMIPRDRRASPSWRVHKGAGREAAFYSCLRWRPFQALLKGIRRWGGTMKMPRARRARGRIFDGFRIGPRSRQRSRPCRLLGGDGVGLGLLWLGCTRNRSARAGKRR